MLDVSQNVLGLFAHHPISNEGSGKDGIFTHIFECAAIARLPRQIDAAAQSHVVPLRAQLASDKRAVVASGLRIPTGRRRDVGGESCRVTSILSAGAHTV